MLFTNPVSLWFLSTLVSIIYNTYDSVSFAGFCYRFFCPKLWVTPKAESSALSLSLCMCSPLKNSSYLHSLNYPRGSQSWFCIRIIWEVLKPLSIQSRRKCLQFMSQRANILNIQKTFKRSRENEEQNPRKI